MRGLAFALILLAAAFPFTAAFADEEVKVVEEEGMAAVTGGDMARARQEAISDALQKAVLKVTLSLVKGDEGKPKDLPEKFLGRAEGFVRDYRVLLSLPDADLYIVRVMATVFAGGIKEELRRHGLLGEASSSPAALTGTVLITGIHNYSKYRQCREAMAEDSPYRSQAALREIGKGTLRYEIRAERPLSEWGEILARKLAAELINHDEGRLILQIK